MSASSTSDSKPGPGLFAGMKRAFGRGRRRFQVSEEEIKTLVDDNDELLDDEKRMIGEILELDELDVSDVMTPRVDIIAVEDTESVRAAIERMQGTGYSRLPVFHESLDQVTGIVHLKGLVPALLEGDLESSAVDYAHDALFVPESKDLFPLLREMQTNRQQMAIVVDEYGGTDGLITVEDIVEEIVGEIVDETDTDDTFITEIAPGEWVADGRFTVEEAQGLGWPVEESDQYDTIAGWFMAAIDVVPQVGREFVTEGYRFRVQGMRRRRIQALRVSRIEPSEREGSGSDSQARPAD